MLGADVSVGFSIEHQERRENVASDACIPKDHLIEEGGAISFPDLEDARCLLYVALSRAKERLMLVVSQANPSPLFQD